MFDNLFRSVTKLDIIIYARLSKEEINKSKDEQSKSIKNQIELCKRYIEDEKKRHSNCLFSIVSILKDDGISGTTFDREEFKELIRLIENKKANMVITTDLSRLGRNHIKTDNYIEEWFPNHNVRYVSIVENIDTYADCITNDIAPIINWSNEHFAKLTSKKIKDRFKLLRQEGLWTGGEPPLGYIVDKKNPHHLIIEENQAYIVKKIFEIFLEQKSLIKVQKILAKTPIPKPSIIKGTHRYLIDDTKYIWSIESLKKVLSNEMYIGHMVQGKTTRLNHKSKKKVTLPKSDWIIIENTHEPIIDNDTFKTVQNLLKKNRNTTQKTHEYLLKGLLICQECKRSIGIQHYKDRKTHYTICNFYRKYGHIKQVCSAHRFNYEKIEIAILKQLKKDCLYTLDFKMIANNISKTVNKKKNFSNKNIINKLKKEITSLEKELDLVYEDRIKHIIDTEQYKRISQLKKNEKENKKLLLQKMISSEKKSKIDYIDYKKFILKYVDHPNRLLITNLIDKIYISKNGEVNVYYNIKKPH